MVTQLVLRGGYVSPVVGFDSLISEKDNLPEKSARRIVSLKLFQKGNMATIKRDCPLCGEELEDTPVIHDVAKCEKTELLKARKEIKKLKESLTSWKDAWFQLREIIGNLWWHHPAIDNDEQRAYYQNHLRNVSEVKP